MTKSIRPSATDRLRKLADRLRADLKRRHINIFSFEELCVPLHDEMINYARKLALPEPDEDESAATSPEWPPVWPPVWSAEVRAIAEDVVQDAYRTAVAMWPSWDSGGANVEHASRAWMYIVVREAFILREAREQRARS